MRRLTSRASFADFKGPPSMTILPRVRRSRQTPFDSVKNTRPVIFLRNHSVRQCEPSARPYRRDAKASNHRCRGSLGSSKALSCTETNTRIGGLSLVLDRATGALLDAVRRARVPMRPAQQVNDPAAAACFIAATRPCIWPPCVRCDHLEPCSSRLYRRVRTFKLAEAGRLGDGCLPPSLGVGSPWWRPLFTCCSS